MTKPQAEPDPLLHTVIHLTHPRVFRPSALLSPFVIISRCQYRVAGLGVLDYPVTYRSFTQQSASKKIINNLSFYSND